eukprot:6463235-Amphidinium_carterae.1
MFSEFAMIYLLGWSRGVAFVICFSKALGKCKTGVEFYLSAFEIGGGDIFVGVFAHPLEIPMLSSQCFGGLWGCLTSTVATIGNQCLRKPSRACYVYDQNPQKTFATVWSSNGLNLWSMTWHKNGCDEHPSHLAHCCIDLWP